MKRVYGNDQNGINFTGGRQAGPQCQKNGDDKAHPFKRSCGCSLIVQKFLPLHGQIHFLAYGPSIARNLVFGNPLCLALKFLFNVKIHERNKALFFYLFARAVPIISQRDLKHAFFTPKWDV